MPNGFGGRYGYGRGMGFGFRGSSPPWPYVGLGRGGLPRCGYFSKGTWASSPRAYQQPSWGRPAYMPEYAPATTQTNEQELDFLRDQTRAIKEQLDEIRDRMSELKGE